METNIEEQNAIQIKSGKASLNIGTASLVDEDSEKTKEPAIEKMQIYEEVVKSSSLASDVDIKVASEVVVTDGDSQTTTSTTVDDGGQVVFDSVWMVIKGNMSLVSSLVTAIISMILGGGTALLNFVISAVIFLTTLFYLLASSGKTYKPVEWFTSMSPSSQVGQSGFGTAVEEAISSVFKASLKMSAFYGLYTWLTHIIFDVDMVFIPSALAAIFGAVPFVGTYWAAFPGALELWVLKGQGVMAIALIVCHMFPAYVVDTAIYSEIKGGHPFMTGLAIAGGMYCMGLEGAFIGPIVLCCLIVVVNMYSSMLKPEANTPSVQ